jgi:hypothetical protein
MPPLIPLAQVIHASEVRHGWRIFVPVLCHSEMVVNSGDAGGLPQSANLCKDTDVVQDIFPGLSFTIAA